MVQAGLIFRALVASPSDCIHERKIIPEVISSWNAVHSLNSAAIIEPILWETHSHPAIGDRPQAIINKQLVEHCDLLIGAFWTRLGTPTGAAESGTAEEIEHFRKAEKPVMLYFSSAPVVPESIDVEQYKALTEYRKQLDQQGLYSKYESLSEFREMLHRHLASIMLELLKEQPEELRQAVSSTVAESPERHALIQFCSDFEAFLRRLIAEWNAERDSGPMSMTDGKYILSRAADEIVHFKSMIVNESLGLADSIAEVLKRLRSIQRHETYLDGGVSFREFWNEGDKIIANITDIVSRLKETTKEAQQVNAADAKNHAVDL
jgi:hypothetical protein